MSKKAYAKVNIFLKILGKRDNYHELASRFVRVNNLYDTITFEANNTTNAFNLIGDFSCELKENTIYKAFLELRKLCPKVDAYFRVYSVRVEKNIPECAGLGGGSSDAAAFMLLANKVFDLHFSKKRLARSAQNVGADVPFFIYEYDSANVTGIGEFVEEFYEEPLNIETFTPNIACSTGKVFVNFREKFYKEFDKSEAKRLLEMKSLDILDELDVSAANDLYDPALDLYPDLGEYTKDNKWYFSGSGSSLFKVIKNG